MSEDNFCQDSRVVRRNRSDENNQIRSREVRTGSSTSTPPGTIFDGNDSRRGARFISVLTRKNLLLSFLFRWTRRPPFFLLVRSFPWRSLRLLTSHGEYFTRVSTKKLGKLEALQPLTVVLSLTRRRLRENAAGSSRGVETKTFPSNWHPEIRYNAARLCLSADNGLVNEKNARTRSRVHFRRRKTNYRVITTTFLNVVNFYLEFV